MTTMDTYSIESNASILSYSIDDDKVIDYGYEDHGPDVRHDFGDVDLKLKVPTPSTAFYVADKFASILPQMKNPFGAASEVGNTDATEVSQSPSQRLNGTWSGSGASQRVDGIAHGTALLDSDDSSCDDILDEDVIDYDTGVRMDVHSHGTISLLDQPPSVPQRESEDYSMTNNDDSSLYPHMPPDRQARKQRSFRRRGGELHGALLKSAVMASMSFDYDDNSNDEVDGTAASGRFRTARRESCQSSISLQSLQDALRSETSPRKRARRGQRRKSNNDDDDDDNNNNKLSEIDKATMTSANSDGKQSDESIEASDLFLNMRVGTGRISSNSSRNKTRSSGNSRTNSGTCASHFRSSIGSSISDFSASAAMAVAEMVREAPPRRVSRKTSYDSRASDYDSDFDTDEWEA